jgi:ATP-dependent DNA helicase DinG
MSTITAADILGPGGRIAARLASYEHRPQQLEMAEAVARAISAKHHLVAEAGTGVGKSFAYLVPAILAATERETDRQGGDDRSRETPPLPKIVVSTHTICL